MKNEKVVVTGGAGFIGSYIARMLLDRGYEVHIIDNLSSGVHTNVPEHAVFHEGDIRDDVLLAKVFTGAVYVYHLAAIPSVQYSLEQPKESNAVNADGTLTVLLAAKNAKVKRVIYSSSCAVYGDTEFLPVSERAPIAPKSPYALQKYIGEMYCRIFSQIYGLETVCLRYFNVYGRGQSSVGAYASVIAKFITLKSEGKPLTICGTGEQTRDFIHVTDVASANLAAAFSEKVGKGEAINIGTGKNFSVKSIAQMIGGEVSYLPPRVELKDSVADSTLAKNILDWEPYTGLKEGLKLLLQKD